MSEPYVKTNTNSQTFTSNSKKSMQVVCFIKCKTFKPIRFALISCNAKEKKRKEKKIK
jgi:hypothetical protein